MNSIIYYCYIFQTGDVNIVLNGDRALDMELDSDCEPESQQQTDDRPRHAFKSVFERKCAIPSAFRIITYNVLTSCC